MRPSAAIILTLTCLAGADLNCRSNVNPDLSALKPGQPLPAGLAEGLSAAGWDRRVGSKLGLWVSAKRQRLVGIEDGRFRFAYTCSTAEKGLGCRVNSFQTPTGWHEIAKRIGDGAPEGAIFVERKYVGRRWSPAAPADKDYVLTRIMWLKGLEPGINAGGDVDSRERYIYIHGTPAEDQLGTPASMGCIRLANKDVIELFDQAPTGTRVLITDW